MATFLHWPIVAVTFLTILVALVAAHELGHYLFARLFGMGVEEFSIGMFGKKPLLTWMRRTYRVPLKPDDDPYRRSTSAGLNFEGGSISTEPAVVVKTADGQALEETTVFTIRPWPVGGFVRIKGMMPEEDSGETKIPGGFYSKPPWQRLIVLLAGPAFSVLFGILILVPYFMSVGENRLSDKPIMGAMLMNMPAYQAGLRPGDQIVSLDGKPVSTFYEVVSYVRERPEVPIQIGFTHEKDHKTATVTPHMDGQATVVWGPGMSMTGEVRPQAKLGVAPIESVARLPFAEAVAESFRMPVMQVMGLLSIVGHPSVAKDSVGGPEAIFRMTSSAVDAGLGPTIQFGAIISISLGIMNLLPIFPLDGGQIVVALAEMMRGGRRLSIEVQNVVGTVGLATLALLVISVITLDRLKYTGKPQPPPKFAPEKSDSPPTRPSPPAAVRPR